MSEDASLPPGESRAFVEQTGFVKNVLWNWFGNFTSLLAAFFISPLMVQKLGEAGYGLWIVVAGMMEYYWLLDFGMRSAVIRFSSYHNARGEPEQLNQVLSTAVAYALLWVPLMIGGAWFGGAWLGQRLNVQSPLFPQLFFAVSLCWSLTCLFATFTACLEGLQCFNVINKTSFFGILMRTVGVLFLLSSGYGVLQVGYTTALCQVLTHAANFFYLRNLFPALRIRIRNVRWSTFVEMISYGYHGVISSIGQRILNQSPQLMLTYFLSERFAGYYGNPRMLLDYSADVVTRTGNVSNPRATQMLATGRLNEVVHLLERVNRFSLALYLPLAIFFAVYGQAFLTVWLRRPEFAAQAAPVLLALLLGYTFGLASQYSCQSILFGLSRHQSLARLLLVEAVLGVAGMWWLIPRYGILAAALWNSSLLLLNRGWLVPWQLTQVLKIPLWRYMADVNRPVGAAIPVYGMALLLQHVLPGTTWLQLISAGGLITLIYAPLAYFFIPGEDRKLLWRYYNRLRQFLPLLPAAPVAEKP